MRWIIASILYSICISLGSGCASLADFGAEHIIVVFDPQESSIEADRATLHYKMCEKEPISGTNICIEWIQEITKFELELENGEVIQCTGIYLEPRYVDGSKNEWLFASKESDSRCEEEMEKAAAAADD